MRAALIACCCLVATAASAQRISRIDGNRLLGLCTSPKTDEQCQAYLEGFGDAVAAGGRERAFACIPASVSGVQLRQVVIKFIADRPQDRNQPGGHIARHALEAAFPCKG